MSTEETQQPTEKKELYKTLTEEDFDKINKISKKIDNTYNLLKNAKIRKPREGIFFSMLYSNDDDRYATNIRDKPNAKERSNVLLNNIDKIEEYFNTYETKISYNDYIKYLEDIRDNSTPESEKQAQQTITTLEADKQQLAQQAQEAQQAFKDVKDIQHQRFADQSNNIKELQDKINDYEQRFKELEKAPLKQNYINDKVFNESYSLDKGELINVILNDINKGKLPENTDPEEIADAIYAKATKRIYKNLKRINNITALTGYNPDIYNKLPAEVAEIIKNHINDKIQEDIRKKNIRYILPKEKPRWEKAMQKYNLNPMLGRGAYTI